MALPCLQVGPVISYAYLKNIIRMKSTDTVNLSGPLQVLNFGWFLETLNFFDCIYIHENLGNL